MQQKNLNQSPWTTEKVLKKSAKHFLFLLISFVISNTFLAYLIGTDALFKIATEPILEHLPGFISIWVFTLVFYFVFAELRELACTMICPYGRLQGVLLDKDSIVVAYDFRRGEPRAKLHKGELRSGGDCIECMQCVQVCPTGIDIRNGTQLECVNCTACMDACDHIMQTIHRPEKLIRYASFNEINEGRKFRLSTRIISYTSVLVILIGLTGFLMIGRSPIETTILRVPGTLYQIDSAGWVSNVYNYEIANKTRNQKFLRIRTSEGELMLAGNQPFLKPNELFKGAFVLKMNKNRIKAMSTKIKIEIYENDKKLDEVETRFLGPS